MARTLLHTFDEALALGEAKPLTYSSQVHATLHELRCTTEPTDLRITEVKVGRTSMMDRGAMPLAVLVSPPGVVHWGFDSDLVPGPSLVVTVRNEGSRAARVTIEVWGVEVQDLTAA